MAARPTGGETRITCACDVPCVGGDERDVRRILVRDGDHPQVGPGARLPAPWLVDRDDVLDHLVQARTREELLSHRGRAVREREHADPPTDRLSKPLALYVFSGTKSRIDAVLAGTSSGSVGVNCTVQQVDIPALPFGGVGPSGMGAYHGRQGFETFTHRRAVLAKPTRLDPRVQYPPYTRAKEWILKRIL